MNKKTAAQKAEDVKPETGVQPADEENGGEDEEENLSLMDHVLALRKVLLVSAGAVFVAFILIFELAIDPLMTLLTKPIADRGVEMIYTAVSEALTTKLLVALVAGVVCAFPIIVWQVWSFIKPALYPKEQKAFRRMFFASLLLFLLGVAFCYGMVYALALDFFMVSGENLATPMLSIDKYIQFLMSFILPFGLAFMLPVFLYITTRMGLTNAEGLAKARKYVLLGLAVVAAILTPPDVVSQVMLLLPMLALYEVSILVARLTKQRVRE